MTDYSKMDDVVINHLVDVATKHQPGEGDSKDYCNNPADAWPIIVNNKICIMPLAWGGWRAMWEHGQVDCEPLRAAMIVFLMMKESEKCSS